MKLFGIFKRKKKKKKAHKKTVSCNPLFSHLQQRTLVFRGGLPKIDAAGAARLSCSKIPSYFHSRAEADTSHFHLSRHFESIFREAFHLYIQILTRSPIWHVSALFISKASFLFLPKCTSIFCFLYFSILFL